MDVKNCININNEYFSVGDIVSIKAGDIVKYGLVIKYINIEKYEGRIIALSQDSIKLDCSEKYKSILITVSYKYISSIEKIKTE